MDGLPEAFETGRATNRRQEGLQEDSEVCVYLGAVDIQKNPLGASGMLLRKPSGLMRLVDGVCFRGWEIV